VVVRENRHSRVPQRRENRICEGSVTELEANRWMEQHIDRRDNAQAREARRANPRALLLINDGHGTALDGVCNRRRLTVIEGLRGMSGDKSFEVLPSGVAEGHNFDVPSGNEFLQTIGMQAPPLPARIEFTRNDVDRQNPIRHRSDDRRRAAGCN